VELIFRRHRGYTVSFALFIFLLSCSAVFAQDWNVTFIFDPFPSPYISDWEANPAMGQATIENNSASTYQVRIELTISRAGSGMIARASSNLFEFPPGSIQDIASSDLVDWGSIDYNKSIEEVALRTGRIPEGDYTACIRLEGESGNLLHDNVCVDFSIVYGDPPMLIYPFDGDTVTSQYPLMQWIPVLTPTRYPVHYDLKIVEMLEGQVPSQALGANRPHYENPAVLTGNFQYPIDALPLRAGKTYAWQVQALDEAGYPPASNNGYSEIWTFKYEIDTTTPQVLRYVAGNVFDSVTGEKIPGARLVLHELDRQISGPDTLLIEKEDSVVTYSDDQGHFIFTDIPNRSLFKIGVHHKDYISNEIVSPQKYYEGDINNFNILMCYAPPGDRRLAGVLKDILTKEPVPGASVIYHAMELQPADSGYEWVVNPRKRLETTTDSEGRFQFSAAADSSRFNLEAQAAPRYINALESGIQIGDIDNYILFITPNACDIMGRVVTAESGGGLAPVAKATVHITRIDSIHAVIDMYKSNPGMDFLSRGKPDASVDTTYTVQRDYGISAYTDGDGNFTAENVDFAYSDGSPAFIRPGYYTQTRESQVVEQSFFLTIEHSKYKTYKSESYDVEPGQVIQTGEHLLQAHKGIITGTVVSGRSPLPEVMVYLYEPVRKSQTPPQDLSPDSLFMVPDSTADSTINGDSTYEDWAGSAGGRPEGEPVAYFQTDENGKYYFNGVTINEPDQKTDHYVVYVESQAYSSAAKPVRLEQDGQQIVVDFDLSAAKGIIYGQISDFRGNSINGAGIELLWLITNYDINELIEYLYRGKPDLKSLESSDINNDGVCNLLDVVSLINSRYENSHRESDGRDYKPVQRTESGGGGYYTLADVDSSWYKLHVEKSGFRGITTETFYVGLGDQIERNEALDASTGSLAITVRRADDSSKPVFNVSVKSPDMTSLLAFTDGDGKLFVPEVIADSITLQFRAVGFADLDTTVLISENGVCQLTVHLEKRVGRFLVIIKEKDGAQEKRLAGIMARLDDNDPVKSDFNGEIWFKDAPVGKRKLKVYPPETAEYDKDYETVETDVDVYEGLNPEPVEIELVPAARMSGLVKNREDNQPVKNAIIAIEGNNKVRAESDKDGKFVLRNVPAGLSITLVAQKAGFKSCRLRETSPEAGKRKSDIIMELEPSPLDSLFGFAVVVDSITDLSGGRKKVSGALVDIPPTFGVKMKDSAGKIYFEGVIVDSSYKPVNDTITLLSTEVDIDIFGMNARMAGQGGLLLEWIDSLHAGRISGEILLEDFISKMFPETEWVPLRIPRKMAPSFWSGGINRGLSKYGITATDTEAKVKLKSVTIGIDYVNSHIDTAGLHFYGSLALGEKLKFDFENLLIGKNDDGAIALKAITIKTEPPVKIPFGVFTVVDSSATWNQTGFWAKGAIVLNALDNREFGFDNLHISPSGEFLSVAVTADEKNGTIKVHGQEFQIERLEFGTDNWEGESPENIKYFAFSGKLKLTMLDEPVELQNLKYTEKGDFTGKIAFNQSKTFAKIVTIQLGSIEFGKSEEKGKFIGITGGVKFGEVKGLSVQATDLRFYYSGAVEFDEISASFLAGPAEVEVHIGYADGVFEGGGLIRVKPVFSAGAEFRYGGSRDWWIRIISGTRIPMGAVELVQVSGGLGRKDDTWKFSLGGIIAPARMDKGISLDILVEVQLTPEGVIIIGNADVEIAGNIAVGRAYIELNFPKERITGSIMFGYDVGVIDLKAQLDIGIQFGQYWYIHGRGSINFLEFFKADGVIAVANNWEWTQGGRTWTLSGFYLELNSDFNIGADWYVIKWGVYFNRHALVYIGWSGDFTGQIDMAGGAWAWIGLDLGIFTIDLIEVRGDIALGAKIFKNGSEWGAGAKAKVRLEAALGSCSRNAGCWSICWTCYVRIFGACVFALPTGAKACASMNLNVDYSSSKGIEVHASF
jgi:hypothetical protein